MAGESAGSGPPALILASASAARLRMLEAAGVPVSVVEAAHVDEDEIKRSLKAEGAPPMRAAETLAELKALRVARRHPEALTLAADQILVADQDWFDKPKDRTSARSQLLALRGRSHELVSSAVLVRGTERLWHHSQAARLTMRPFSEDFLDRYLDQAGERVLHSVGAYQVETLGVQLFAEIRGDCFTILGLPLLPLLEMLRNHHVLKR